MTPIDTNGQAQPCARTTCQAVVPVGADRCPSCGTFARSNTASQVHGLGAIMGPVGGPTRLPADLRCLVPDVADFEAACLVDEGGDAADLPARRRALIAYRVRLHRRILQLDAGLELHGLQDRKGRLRANWLQRLESLISVALRLDGELGLERKQKRALTLEQHVEAIARRKAAATAESTEQEK